MTKNAAAVSEPPSFEDRIENLTALLLAHDLAAKQENGDGDGFSSHSSSLGSDFYDDDNDDSEYEDESSCDDEDHLDADDDEQATNKGSSSAVKGVYLSSAMTNFLRKSASSDSDLLAHLKQYSTLQEAPAAELTTRRRDSDTAAGQGLVHVVQTKSAQSSSTGQPSQETPPYQVMLDIMKETCGATDDMELKFFAINHQNNDYWAPRTSAGYTVELTDAVRQGDVTTLQKLASRHHNFQCCNSFGESIVHTAARRGHLAVLEFLHQHADVSLRVCCDSGRNPLHDACWTTTPNFACIEFLLQHHAEFMLGQDQRGFVPLKYVPREVWGDWNAFLKQHQDLVAKAVTTTRDFAQTL